MFQELLEMRAKLAALASRHIFKFLCKAFPIEMRVAHPQSRGLIQQPRVKVLSFADSICRRFIHCRHLLKIVADSPERVPSLSWCTESDRPRLQKPQRCTPGFARDRTQAVAHKEILRGRTECDPSMSRDTATAGEPF